MFGPKNWLVIMVTGDALQIIGQGESIVQTIPLPDTIVTNMELVNKDALYTLLTDWTKQRLYTNTSLIWLLAPSICFEHTLSSTETNQIDSETVQFLDTVPFESVTSHIYSFAEGKQIIAVNQNLILAFMQGFTLHGYVTRAVVPSRLLSSEPTLTKDIAVLAIKKIGELGKDSLISPMSSPFSPAAPPAKPKSSLPLLLGFFTVLLAILVIVIILNQ